MRKCSGRARRCAGASGGLRRGMCCEGGEECIAQPAGVRRRGEGVRKCSGRARRCAGAGADLRRGMCCEVGRRASSRGGGAEVRGKGVRKCSGRACRSAGAGADLRRGMGGEVGGFNALSPQPLARTRIIILRPPRHRREIAAMGTKDAPCEHPPPAKTSAFAASAFIFPPRRSHFPRMAFGGAHEDFGIPPNDVRPCRSNVHTSAPSFTFPPHTLRRRPRRLRPPAAVVIHNGLSTEKLSTSLLAALCKTFSPSRLRTRIIIYRSSVGRSRECPRRCGEEVAPLWPRVPRRRAQGGGGRRQRRTPPRTATRTFPAYGPVLARLWAKCRAQRRKCTR